jgi:flagellar biosynthesis/type III secretory pathway protein FliH
MEAYKKAYKEGYKEEYKEYNKVEEEYNKLNLKVTLNDLGSSLLTLVY